MPTFIPFKNVQSWLIFCYLRLAYNSFRNILERKQSRYGAVLTWLNAEIRKLSVQKDIKYGRVTQVACIEA